MAINAGDITWNIGADLKGFQKGVDSAKKQAKGVASSIAKNSKAIGASLAVVGGAITATLGKTVQHFAAIGDQIQKMSIKTGVSTEALSQLGFVAEQSGTSIEVLGKAFKNQADFLEDARDGLSTSTDAMEKLGLSMDDFEGKNPEEVFMMLSESIASIEDPMQRAALANDVFKRSGSELLPMFASGAAGIREMREEAERLGISMSQEQADSAAKFTDTLNSLKKSFSGIALQIGSALVPILNVMMERLTVIVSGVSSWMANNQALTATIISVVGAIGGIALALAPVFLLLPGIIAAFGAVSAAGALLAAKITLGVVAAFLLLRPLLQNVVVWVKANWDQISGIFKTYVNIIITSLKTFGTLLGAAFKLAAAILTGFGKGVGDIFSSITGTVDIESMTFLDIIEFLVKQIEAVSKEILAVVGELSKWLELHWQDIVKSVRWAVNNIINPLGNLASKFIAAKNKITSAVNAIIGAWNKLISKKGEVDVGGGGGANGFAGFSGGGGTIGSAPSGFGGFSAGASRGSSSRGAVSVSPSIVVNIDGSGLSASELYAEFEAKLFDSMATNLKIAMG